MGNEQQGLTPTLAQCCEALLRVPMSGEADSLNLAVATALVAFEIRSARLPRADNRSAKP
jgi:TrmH family RNA methyltransferase